MVGLSAVSEPFIKVLLGEKWLFAATLLSVICFSMMWYPIHAINLNLLQVKGRSDLFLRLEIIKKMVGVSILCITIPRGLIAMCIGSVFSSIICLIVNTYYTGKLINVGFVRQMMDLFPILFLSLMMGGLVYGICHYLSLTPLVALIIGLLIGFLFYVSLAKILKFAEWNELMMIIRKK
jgi:O-antigen/teichoic acid export membrane protein